MTLDEEAALLRNEILKSQPAPFTYAVQEIVRLRRLIAQLQSERRIVGMRRRVQ